MSTIQLTIGMRVRVDISGLQATHQSAGVTAHVRIGSGPGMTATAPGTIVGFDNPNRQVLVRLDGSIAGRSVYPFPPERIVVTV